MNIQGHRGCRGIYPENTLISMQKALELNVHTLEMDVVVTQDKKVILSHEPYFNEEITTLPNGSYISEGEGVNYNIYQMDYSEIIRYDVGLKPHPRFPFQKKIAATKPLFVDVLKLGYTIQPDILYNVEIKSTPETDNSYHPIVSEYCELVMAVILAYPIPHNITIQSFDYRVLEYLHLHYPAQPLSMLSENGLSLKDNLKLISFIPTYYSPDYLQLTQEDIVLAKEKNMVIIPWTVNTVEEGETLNNWGIRDIITDYPNYFL